MADKIEPGDYLYVRVLLLYWENAASAFLDMLNTLERVFRENYTYTTEIWPIPDQQAYPELSKKLRSFLTDETPETLVIVYYGGHARMKGGRTLVWQRDKSNSPEVSWGALQHEFFEKQCDILLIFDCCSAASMADEKQGGRVVEALVACGSGEETPMSGEECFTVKLVSNMREASRRKGGVQVADIYHELLMEYRLSPKNKVYKQARSPHHLLQTHEFRTLVLRRMESFYTARTSFPRRRSIAGTINSDADTMASAPGTARSRPGRLEAITMMESEMEVEAADSATMMSSGASITSTTAYEVGHSVLMRGGAPSDGTSEVSSIFSTEDENGSESTSITRWSSITTTFVPENKNDASWSVLVDRNLEACRRLLSVLADLDEICGLREWTTPISASQRVDTRIVRELLQLVRLPPSSWYTLRPLSESYSLCTFLGTFRGPPDTPYADGIFHICLAPTDEYPYKPPRVWFVTKILHPNIDSNGAVCADILRPGHWCSFNYLETLVVSIAAVLDAPEWDDSVLFGGQDGVLLPGEDLTTEGGRHRFTQRAEEWTKMYATGEVIFPGDREDNFHTVFGGAAKVNGA